MARGVCWALGLAVWAACGGSEPPPRDPPRHAPSPTAPALPQPPGDEPPAPEDQGAHAGTVEEPAGDETAPTAEAQGVEPEATLPPAFDGAQSTSVGAPNNGHVRHAFRLPDHGFGYRHNPARPEEANYATAETLNALIRAAARVARELPGGEVTINDLGLENGGPIAHHGSHQAGRDVDVLFYLLDGEGDPRSGIGAPIEPDGHGTDFGELSRSDDDVDVFIDLPRTWRYVAALIEDPEAHLQRIFLAEHLRAMLLEEGRRQGAAEETLARFADETCQPSYPHDDHFHFRFYCTAEDIPRGCRDARPLFDWRAEELRAAGVRPRFSAGPGRRAEVTTAAEARRRAGRMAPEVRAFLARRRAWMERPHPGRRYCR